MWSGGKQAWASEILYRLYKRLPSLGKCQKIYFLSLYISWGQSVVYAMETFISNPPVETSKVVVISYAWLHPASQANVISNKQWSKPQTQKS